MNDHLRIHRKFVIPLGIFSGLILGIIARAWMRWISTDPEFTWSGTFFIVLAFVIFGAVHSLVFFAREGGWSSGRVNLIRIASIFLSLPLFVAAGSAMFPTVLTGSLARWRTDWWIWLRWILAGCSVIIPIFIIRDIGNDFGWGIATFGRVLLFIAIYSVVISAIRSAVSPIARV
ncbi:MAG: hypothetical protein Q8K86_04795 [Candidatus Nanopelagicaceae bacterium]|nr:hypothetical protein [Candidatus Nanopelagicaceae bacterium]